MRKILTVLLTSFFSLPLFAQLNVTLSGQLEYPNKEVMDIWGYTAPNGTEYALVCVDDGLSIVDISTNSAAPTEVHFVPGIGATWRDVKVWGTYCYVVNETGNGMAIVDLSDIGQNVTSTEWQGDNGNLETAHNIWIDENGIAYILGSNLGVGGALFLDLNNDPLDPEYLGAYDTRYIHDAYVRGDTMWSAEVNDGIFSVVDVSDKANPVVLAVRNTPNNFTHNTWLSDDGNILYTTDEVDGAYVTSYDVSDLSNISELDRFQSSPGEFVAPHNTFVLGDYVLTSYYRDGLVIADATNPENMVEVGNFDTSPLSGPGFNGCWGIYPYFASGAIVASDMEEGLYVLDATYVRAAYLEGTVTDSASGALLNAARVEIIGADAVEFSDFTGEYGTGSASAGTYAVSFSKPGYFPKTISNVTLTNGQLTELDVELKPLPRFPFSVQVVSAADLNPIFNATISIQNQDFQFTRFTDNDGTIDFPDFIEGEYDIIAGRWGYVTQAAEMVMIDSTTGTYQIALETGYYDDFIFDFSWQVSGFATAGIWEIGDPEPTFWQGGSLSNPGIDVAGDIGPNCIMTGNGGDFAGFDDIDDGETILTSPLFDLSDYNDPYISYYSWFFNDGGNGDPVNDSLRIELSNGNETVTLNLMYGFDAVQSQWQYHQFRIRDIMEPTADMRFTLTAGDYSPGHLVEAALDLWRVTDSTATGIENADLISGTQIQIAPNPASDRAQITSEFAMLDLSIYNLNGKQLFVQQFEKQSGHKAVMIDLSKFTPGMYLIHTTNAAGSEVKRLLIAE